MKQICRVPGFVKINGFVTGLTVCDDNTTHLKVGKIIKLRDNCVGFK